MSTAENALSKLQDALGLNRGKRSISLEDPICKDHANSDVIAQVVLAGILFLGKGEPTLTWFKQVLS